MTRKLTAEEERRLHVFLQERKRAYQLAFTSPAGEQVLKDLATFCRAKETCVVPGAPDMTNVLEGRREVYLRIQQHLELTPEQLRRFLKPPPETDPEVTHAGSGNT